MPAPARAFPQRVTVEHYRPSDTEERYLELVGATDSPANVQASTTTESTANQDQQSARFNVYLPAGVEVSGHDVVIFQGRRLQAQGGGRPMTDFAGRPHHVEVLAQEVV
jgi:hypothetical protein